MEYKLTLLMTEFVTHDVKRFIFERPSGFRYSPGQGVDLAIDEEGWRDKARPFSPTSLPDDKVVEFTIKEYRDHHGVTERLHALTPGAGVIISEPWGTIAYNGPGVFIAGGAGITPFISIFRHLAAKGGLAGHSLIFSNKTPADIICEKEFRHYLGERALFLCTRATGSGCVANRIDREFLRDAVGRFDQHFYTCGPKPFVKAINQALTELGATPSELVFER